jgi:hypothetical protein
MRRASTLYDIMKIPNYWFAGGGSLPLIYNLVLDIGTRSHEVDSKGDAEPISHQSSWKSAT